MRFFQVDIKYATFGIKSNNDIIVDAPPIANWMIGKTLQQIKPWLIDKSAKVREIDQISLLKIHINAEIRKIESDERFILPQADIKEKPVLALAQTHLASRLNALKEILDKI